MRRALAKFALPALLFLPRCDPVAPGDHGPRFESSSAPLKEGHQMIVSGAPAPLDSAVFFLEVTTARGVATCSAALITPDILLTAAHCVTGQFGPIDCRTARLSEALSVDHFRVSNEPDLTGAPAPTWNFPEIAEVRIVHSDALLCGHDIALLRLSTPLATEVATPLAVPQEPWLDVLPEERTYSALGYGSVHPSGTGEKTRRSASPLEALCTSKDECEAQAVLGAAGAEGLPAPEIAPGEWIGQGAGCPGDSGGPALDTSRQTPGIVGVLSRGHADCSLNIYSFPQSEAFRDAMRNMIQFDGSLPIYEIPSWATEPDPSEMPEKSPLGGAGGMGGAPSSPPEPSGGSTSAPRPSVGSWRSDRGCNLGTSGSNLSPTPWPVLSLIMIFLWGARRRSAPARESQTR
jgi:hypothetical protein